MGWWSVRKDTKEIYDPIDYPHPLDQSELLEVGDQPLDEIGSALKKVIKLYKRELRRKPTPDELAELLESSIRIIEEDIFDDMDERELELVQVKLKPRPKRPKPKTGDFFAIPLPSGSYGYGRVIKVELRVLLWMRLLDVGSQNLLCLADVQNSKATIDLKTGTSKIDSTEWPIIGHRPLSDEQKTFEKEPQWITKYTTTDIEEIAEWKLAKKKGLPPKLNSYPPFEGYHRE